MIFIILKEIIAKIVKKGSEYREKADIWHGIKEETRNLLVFYRDECSADLSDLPTDTLKDDVLNSLNFIPKVYALKHLDTFHDMIVSTHNAVLQGTDTLDITDPKHANVQKYIKSILKETNDYNAY